jgi:hypothetical protein
MKRGARVMMFLFGCTIATAVSFHNFLHLPPFLGMMTGLAYLQIFGYYLRRTHLPVAQDDALYGHVGEVPAFDSYREIARAEWDTLLFFFGVIMCVGGLGFIGYLDHLSQFAYLELGATIANVLVGIASSIVDNIPVMVAVLQMYPEMDMAQWLLVTLTAGVGGSWWQSSIDWLGCGRRSDGSGARTIHLLFASQVDAGNCRRFCTQYLGAFPGQRPLRGDHAGLSQAPCGA